MRKKKKRKNSWKKTLKKTKHQKTNFKKRSKNLQVSKNLFKKKVLKKNFFCHVSESRGRGTSVMELGEQKSLRLILDWSDGSYHDWI